MRPVDLDGKRAAGLWPLSPGHNGWIDRQGSIRIELKHEGAGRIQNPLRIRGHEPDSVSSPCHRFNDKGGGFHRFWLFAEWRECYCFQRRLRFGLNASFNRF